MLLFLLLAAVEPGNGLDLPPADDPVGRWIATGVAIFIPLSAIVVARIQAKKGSASNGPTPLVSDTATPRLDVGQQYLEKYVRGLESRVESAETENRELHKQVTTLIEDRATFKAQNEALRADIAELREQVQELRGQLRGRRADG